MTGVHPLQHFGGQKCDFMRIALEMPAARVTRPSVYIDLEGDVPDGFRSAWYSRALDLQPPAQLRSSPCGSRADLDRRPAAAAPKQDARTDARLYAADACFEERDLAATRHRQWGRYCHLP